MNTYLKLKFKNSIGKTVFMRIANPKMDLDKETVSQAMKKIASTEAFKKDEIFLYAEPVSAKYVTTTEKAIIEAEDVN